MAASLLFACTVAALCSSIQYPTRDTQQLLLETAIQGYLSQATIVTNASFQLRYHNPQYNDTITFTDLTHHTDVGTCTNLNTNYNSDSYCASNNLTASLTPNLLVNYTAQGDTNSGDYSYMASALTVAPVPSQPSLYWTGCTPWATSSCVTPAFTLPNLTFASSAFSSEYGHPLQGCLITWGASPYTGSDIPATLTAALPLNSFRISSTTQASVTNVAVASLATSLSFTANTPYDFYGVCYNAAGASYPAVLYQYVTIPTLPQPPTITASLQLGSLVVVVTPPTTTGNAEQQLSQYTQLTSCTVLVGPHLFTSYSANISAQTLPNFPIGESYPLQFTNVQFDFTTNSMYDVLAYCTNNQGQSKAARTSFGATQGVQVSSNTTLNATVGSTGLAVTTGSTGVASATFQWPAGSVSVTFDIQLSGAVSATSSLILATLLLDIDANLASYFQVQASVLLPYVMFTSFNGQSLLSASLNGRRLLQTAVPVTFVINGQVTAVVPSTSASGGQVSAQLAASSFAQSVQNGSFNTSHSNATVPQNQSVNVASVSSSTNGASKSAMTAPLLVLSFVVTLAALVLSA